MRNFFGRILILVCAIINVILFFIITGNLVFDFATNYVTYEDLFNGPNSLANIFDLSLLALFIIAFLWVTIWCIRNIIIARSMRHALIGTFILFFIDLIYIFYHLFMPGILINNLGLFIGIFGTATVTTIALSVGCFANYFKDCHN